MNNNERDLLSSRLRGFGHATFIFSHDKMLLWVFGSTFDIDIIKDRMHSARVGKMSDCICEISKRKVLMCVIPEKKSIFTWYKTRHWTRLLFRSGHLCHPMLPMTVAFLMASDTQHFADMLGEERYAGFLEDVPATLDYAFECLEN